MATGSLRPGPQARSTRTGCRHTATGCPPWITTASAHSSTCACACSCWGIHWRWRHTQLRANASCSYLHQSLGSPEPGRQGATKCNRRLEETQRDSRCSHHIHRHWCKAQPRTRISGRSSFKLKKRPVTGACKSTFETTQPPQCPFARKLPPGIGTGRWGRIRGREGRRTASAGTQDRGAWAVDKEHTVTHTHTHAHTRTRTHTHN